MLNANMGEGLKITLVLTAISFLSHVCLTWGQDDNLNYFTSRSNELCYNSCRMRGRDYYWCKTRTKWDYCSGRANTDYKGNECRDDHPCEKHGRDYYWCQKKVGGWDYCGKVAQKEKVFVSSTYRSRCTDKCVQGFLRYYWCHTGDGWDYCSPDSDVTYKDVPCRSNNPCHTYGETYTWCKTDSSWGYCGIVIIPESKEKEGEMYETYEAVLK